MNRIPLKVLARLTDLGPEIGELYDKLDAILQDAQTETEAVIEAVNAKRAEAHELLVDYADKAESYYDDRSQAWQDGDKGSLYSEWKDALTQLRDELDTEIDPPDLPTVERPDWIDELGSVPADPEST